MKLTSLYIILAMLLFSLLQLSCDCGDDDDDNDSEDSDDDVDDDSDDDSDDDVDDDDALVEATVIVDDPYLDLQRFAMGGVAGSPALVWYHYDLEGEDYRLYFLRRGNLKEEGWPDQSESVLLPTDGEDVGRQALIELADGTPMIILAFGENHYLSYIKAKDQTGSAWDDPVVIDDANYAAGSDGISVLPVNGAPAVAYNADSTNDLFFVRATDASAQTWNAPVMAAEHMGQWGEIEESRMAIVNGRPAVAYKHWDIMDDIRKLYYVRASDANGDNWETPVLIDDSGNAGDHLDLEFFDGVPVIQHGSEGGTIYTVWGADADGDSWEDPYTWPGHSGFLWQMVVIDPIGEAKSGENGYVNIMASVWEEGTTKSEATARHILSIMDPTMADLQHRLALALYGMEYGVMQLAAAIAYEKNPEVGYSFKDNVANFQFTAVTLQLFYWKP